MFKKTSFIVKQGVNTPQQRWRIEFGRANSQTQTVNESPSSGDLGDTMREMKNGVNSP